MEQELALMIPILAVVLAFGVGFWSIYWGYQKKRLQYDERRSMIEKGMEPPPVLPDEREKKVTPEDCLQRGTIMLFLGIGLGIAYFVVLGAAVLGAAGDGPPPWLFGVGGAIVGLLGVGNLTYYAIAKRRQSEGPSADIPRSKPEPLSGS